MRKSRPKYNPLPRPSWIMISKRSWARIFRCFHLSSAMTITRWSWNLSRLSSFRPCRNPTSSRYRKNSLRTKSFNTTSNILRKILPRRKRKNFKSMKWKSQAKSLLTPLKSTVPSSKPKTSKTNLCEQTKNLISYRPITINYDRKLISWGNKKMPCKTYMLNSRNSLRRKSKMFKIQ